ncbi:MAG: hypothetical protein GXX96_24355 [Planctomycetaceae bacterium]|nr:hypothetical protein [Planctomycetaceae bacterium]
MKLRVERPLAEPGRHSMRFECCKQEDDGRQLRWVFVSDDGLVASAKTSSYIAANTQAHSLACAIFGRDLAIDEEIDTNEIVGAEYDIIVVRKGIAETIKKVSA